MSRTYRRKGTKHCSAIFMDFDYFVSDYVWEGYRIVGRKYFEKDSKEYAKGLARFHSEKGTSRMKEPGPGFFRRIFKRKYNAKVRNELAKYFRNPEYEVDLHQATEKYHMDYWT